MLNLCVKGLNAYFELQATGGKLRDHFAQSLRQVIGDNLKMQKQVLVEAMMEKLQYSQAVVNLKIKGPVDKLEVARASLVQTLHLLQKFIKFKWPCGLVQR